ncbi:MAG: winged helix-turn-helix domain-containing protein [Cyanothece sp. SIO1E1]|nr:winged helix-turn-helix domain-containing protein [Cyanothece sp. SIO1E1]
MKARLDSSEGFCNYGEIQQWLEETFERPFKYKTVYQTVHYQLGAKLKVPRPRSIKQNEEHLSQFKKTSPWPC